MSNTGKLILQGIQEEREEFARRLKEYTEQEGRKEEERKAAEIENAPALKALKEERDEKMKMQQQQERLEDLRRELKQEQYNLSEDNEKSNMSAIEMQNR